MLKYVSNAADVLRSEPELLDVDELTGEFGSLVENSCSCLSVKN